MGLSPASFTLGTALAVGGGATALMATSNNRVAREARMGTTIAGLSTAGLSIGIGWAAYANWGTEGGLGAGKWASSTAHLTGMTKSGQLILAGLGIATGVAIANLAAGLVLNIDDKSLAGGK